MSFLLPTGRIFAVLAAIICLGLGSTVNAIASVVPNSGSIGKMANSGQFVVQQAPVGFLDSVTMNGNQATVNGWALDPNRPDLSIATHVYAKNGKATLFTSFLADGQRDDVNRVLGVNGRHGFSGSIALLNGLNTICAFGIGEHENTAQLVGCWSVQFSGVASAPIVGPSNGMPGEGNTGVPDGTKLTTHVGDITVTQAGTILDGLDVHGSVYVKADNVTIRRSLIRGGPAAPTNKALIASWWNNTNLKIYDSTLVADYPSYYIDGVSGSNLSVERVDISRVVDPVKVVNGGVKVVDSWLHNNAHFVPDPQQKDGRTHDDGIQIEGGQSIVITGNVIEGSHNAAIMITQNYAVVGNVKIASNWLRDGACTLNMSPLGKGGGGAPFLGVIIEKNRFSPAQYGTTCPMRLPSASNFSLTGNVWDSNSKEVVPVRF